MIHDEIYDVVDKNGIKTGTATWTEVHTKGLLHQNVHGILFRDTTKKQVLMKKRTMIVGQGKGKYEIAVAGHIRSGDTPRQSIIRELEEELFGYNPIPKTIQIKQITKYFHSDFANNNEIAYLYEIISSGPFIRENGAAQKSFWTDWSLLLKDTKDNPEKYAQYSITAIENYLRGISRFG